MAKAILRVAKHTSGRSVAGMGRHMHRTINTPNADPERLKKNATYTPADGWVRWSDAPPPNVSHQLKDKLADFEQRGGVVRKDSVLAIELLLSASPEWFKQASPQQQKRWLEAQTEFLEEVFGAKNVLQLTLHLDETTPHIHAFVVPEIEMAEKRGRKRKDGTSAPEKLKPGLAASHWLDGRVKVGELQDRYAAAMEPFGLERGLKGSQAKHRTIRSYYAAAENVMAQEVAALRIPPPPELPEPVGIKEQTMAAAGFVPRAAAVDTVAKARKQAALAAAKQAREEANAARAAAIEATIQLRQLLDRFHAFGGTPVLDKVDDLEKRLEKARLELDRINTELAKVTADRQADQQHIDDLREWGEGLVEHIRGLEEIDVPSNGFSLKS